MKPILVEDATKVNVEEGHKSARPEVLTPVSGKRYEP